MYMKLCNVCFSPLRLGLYREAEKQFRSALNHQEMVDTYLYLTKVVIIAKGLYILRFSL